MQGRTFRHIMLTAAWLVGLYLLYWSLVRHGGAQPHLVRIGGVALLLFAALDTVTLARGRGRIFTLLTPLVLVVIVAVVALTPAKTTEEGVVEMDEQPLTRTVIRDTLDRSLLRPRDTRPKPPYHQPDEVVALNLLELRRLAANEWNAQHPQFRDSPTHIGVKNFGTDRIRVCGRWTSEHILKLRSDEGVLAMMHKRSANNPYVPTGFIMRFPSKEEADRMEVNVWYEIMGRLVIDPENGIFPVQDMPPRDRIKIAHLEVDSVRVIERPSEEDGMLEHSSLAPPHFPIVPVYREEK